MIRRIKRLLIDLLYPVKAVCLGCGDECGCNEPFLCDACRAILTPSNVRTTHADWKQHGLGSTLFVYYYGKPVKGLIRAYKFDGVKMLADMMGSDMSRLIEEKSPNTYDMIVPVPLHPSRLCDRGFNQAEALARVISERTGCELRTDVLRRIRKTKQQSKLKRHERSANTMAAFKAELDLTGMRILLVDDVITTGSTFCACADALKAAGAKEIQAIALAGSRTLGKKRPGIYRLKKQ